MGGLEFDVIARTWPYLLKGLQYTIQLTIIAAIGGVIWGTLLALARLSSIKWLSMLAAGDFLVLLFGSHHYPNDYRSR
jgi:glutamate/aspartate transport system permease protein